MGKEIKEADTTNCRNKI